MNKVLAWLIAFILVIMGILSPIITGIVEPPRHIDPSTAKDQTPSPVELLMLYSSAVNSLNAYDFLSAKDNLSLAYNVYVPENLRYIIYRFNDLLDQLIDYVNITKNYVDDAEECINSSDLSTANKLIQDGLLYLAKAKVIYNELSSVARDFTRLGVSLQKLDTLLSSIGDMLEKLETKLYMLENIVKKRSSNLINTSIYISVSPRNITVGNIVDISGYLVDAEGNPLGNRTITIHIESITIEVLTDKDGSFSIHRQIYIYKPEALVYAEYYPRGSDYNVYEYSRSDYVTITIFYVKPWIMIKLYNDTVLPGSNISVRVETLPNLSLIVNTPFTREFKVSSANGSVLFNITVPLNVDEGVYTLSIRTIPSGIIGPAEERVYFKVYRLMPDVEVHVPQYIFTGIPYTIIVSSNVDSRISFFGKGIGFEHEEECVKKIVSEIMVPHSYLDTSLNIYIRVDPLDQRYRSKIIAVDVKVYNTIITLASVLLIIVMILYMAYSMEKLLPRTASVKPLKQERPGIESYPQARELIPTGVREKLQPLYRELVNIVERISGIEFRKDYTFREYLVLIKKALPSNLYLFIEKVFLGIERVVYGGSRYLHYQFIESLYSMLESLVVRIREYLGKKRG